jgi:hypothetical protein
MFIISQISLDKLHICEHENISTYSIVIGLVIYGAIYLYFLFYNSEYINLFNKFVIYIVGIDLLLSTFYHLNTSKKVLEENQPLLNNATNDVYDADVEEDVDTETSDNINRELIEYTDEIVENTDEIVENTIENTDEIVENTIENTDEIVEIDIHQDFSNVNSNNEIQDLHDLEEKVETKIDMSENITVTENVIESVTENVTENRELENVVEVIPKKKKRGRKPKAQVAKNF